MDSLFLSPHNDDETLFGAFTLLRFKPFVIVCLKSKLQADRGYGITADQREAETAAAMKVLDCEWKQLPFPDDVADWASVEKALVRYRQRVMPDMVFAPWPEGEGHAHHNTVGILAERIFGADRVTHYMTYTTNGKSRSDFEVQFEPEWVATKHLALACYESQSSHPSTWPHFLRDQTEFYAAQQ